MIAEDTQQCALIRLLFKIRKIGWKVKFPMCLIKQYALKMYRSADVASHILNFSTSWRCGQLHALVALTLGVKEPLGGPRSSLSEEIISCPYRESNPDSLVVHPLAYHYSGQVIPAHIQKYTPCLLSYLLYLHDALERSPTVTASTDYTGNSIACN
jgi:hypothetical protein